MTGLFTLLPEAVGTITADTKPAILEQLATRFALVYRLDREAVLRRILERESLGSTGFGRGVAIPHARLEGVGGPVATVLRLSGPVDFDAADGGPVELVFGLLSPEAGGAAHLQALAAISRLMRDERMREALVRASDPEALYSMLSDVIDRDAA